MCAEIGKSSLHSQLSRRPRESRLDSDEKIRLDRERFLISAALDRSSADARPLARQVRRNVVALRGAASPTWLQPLDCPSCGQWSCQQAGLKGRWRAAVESRGSAGLRSAGHLHTSHEGSAALLSFECSLTRSPTPAATPCCQCCEVIQRWS